MKIFERNSIGKILLFNFIIIFGIFLFILCTILSVKIVSKKSFELKNYYKTINETFIQLNVSKEIPQANVVEAGDVNKRKNVLRNKRFLIFEGNGVVKLVIGVSLPIQLADRVRSLSYFYNLQMQYTPAPRPLYGWSAFNTSTFPGFLRKTRETSTKLMGHDFSREFLYRVIENAFESAGLPGTQCLLKIICEIARLPFYVPRENEFWTNRPIFHEILNAIFTPKFPNVNSKYFYAYNIGKHGAGCSYECPKYKNWLERCSVYV